ncbi:MAG: haloalkane dehalogenase [Thaumarchaeota archaeon]|nr:haloalkane dehalogenase [Nitrososphaerota archaeon]
MADFAAFPFTSRYVSVNGFKIHYIEEGRGRPILLIHGNPTWSYEWRNIIPPLSKQGRCIAFDLIGFGRSEKPDIEYTYQQHAAVVDGFIKEMNLKDMVMVLHDWGASFGLWHTINHRENIKGIAMFEPQITTSTWDDYQGERRKKFEMFRDRTINYELAQVKNLFVEQIINSVMKKERMTGVIEMYREPFPTAESRKAIRRFPEMLPIGEDSETYKEFKQIEEGLSALSIPLLLLTVTPGAIMNESRLARVKKMTRNLEVKHLGPGLHHFQEDYPQEIAAAIIQWMKTNNLN